MQIDVESRWLSGCTSYGKETRHPNRCDGAARPAAHRIHISHDVHIDFFPLFALTEREMQLKLNKGLSALTRVLAEGEVYTELLDPEPMREERKRSA
ncbi:MAG TPA: hypothetical protein VK797_15755 [Tepidisphaeraceae bacterium]|nr:hypothetical protein [Tepidisphaeraceae bacterium]